MKNTYPLYLRQTKLGRKNQRIKVLPFYDGARANIYVFPQ